MRNFFWNFHQNIKFRILDFKKKPMKREIYIEKLKTMTNQIFEEKRKCNSDRIKKFAHSSGKFSLIQSLSAVFLIHKIIE